jgi:hypothetical protein
MGSPVPYQCLVQNQSEKVTGFDVQHETHPSSTRQENRVENCAATIRSDQQIVLSYIRAEVEKARREGLIRRGRSVPSGVEAP